LDISTVWVATALGESFHRRLGVLINILEAAEFPGPLHLFMRRAKPVAKLEQEFLTVFGGMSKDGSRMERNA